MELKIIKVVNNLKIIKKMKMSNSSSNIRGKINEKQEIEKPSKKFVKKHTSLQDDYIKEEILKKLNEGTVLHFIRNSSRKETVKTNFSENVQEMKYDLCMINKYDEDLNSDLSFISEFDLEEDENKNDDSFNSSFDENSVEEIEIIKKIK